MMVVRTIIAAICACVLSMTGARAADSAADSTSHATAPGKLRTPNPKAEPTAPQASPTAAQAAATKADVAKIKGAIVGKWKSPDDGEVMDFGADGSARVNDPNATFIGTYQFLDDGTLRVDLPAFMKQNDFVYAVELKDPVLILTLKGRNPRKYERIK
jgi:uncharacterized protein (DUF2147 family)